MYDLPIPVRLAVLGLATLLPLVALGGAVSTWSSSGPYRRTATALLILVATVLAYLHPLAQEAMNHAYLEPKLERARALSGEAVERMFVELGEPNQVVRASPGVSGSYGFASYRSAWWAPLAQVELIVPLSNDGERVGVIAHFAD
ncbi:MAG: hypothetical protein ACYTFV_08115 [Planctomycetota bacterium]|jgi:hypothetical protein